MTLERTRRELTARVRAEARHFVQASRFSAKGLLCAVRNETAIRWELALLVVNTAAVAVLRAPLAVRLYLFALPFGVICVELLNSAVEAVVDLVSPDWNELAGMAKDYGSAAVFVSLVLTAASWGLVIVGLL